MAIKQASDGNAEDGDKPTERRSRQSGLLTFYPLTGRYTGCHTANVRVRLPPASPTLPYLSMSLPPSYPSPALPPPPPFFLDPPAHPPACHFLRFVFKSLESFRRWGTAGAESEVHARCSGYRSCGENSPILGLWAEMQNTALPFSPVDWSCC